MKDKWIELNHLSPLGSTWCKDWRSSQRGLRGPDRLGRGQRCQWKSSGAFWCLRTLSQCSSPPRSPGRRSCDRRRPAESRVPRLLGGSATSPEGRTNRHPSRLPAAVIQNKEASFELKRQTYAHILVIQLCGIGIKQTGWCSMLPNPIFRCFPFPPTRPLKGLYAVLAKRPKPDTKSFQSPLSTENSYNEKPKNSMSAIFVCQDIVCLSRPLKEGSKWYKRPIYAVTLLLSQHRWQAVSTVGQSSVINKE